MPFAILFLLVDSRYISESQIAIISLNICNMNYINSNWDSIYDYFTWISSYNLIGNWSPNSLSYTNSSIYFFIQEAQIYAQENGLFFMETSAKTATNVNGIFYETGIFSLFYKL